MGRKTVTLDVDGVLLQSREKEFFAFVAAVYGVQGDIEVYRATHNLKLAFNSSRKVITTWFKEFGRSKHCPIPEPVPGARTGLQRLIADGFTVETVSQRPSDDVLLLRESFSHFFMAIDFAAFHFVSGGLKHMVIRQAGAAVHVEDSLYMARNVAREAQVPVIVFPHPFNWHHPRCADLLYTEAHALADEGMQFSDWCLLWQRAWQEIPVLLMEVTR